MQLNKISQWLDAINNPNVLEQIKSYNNLSDEEKKELINRKHRHSPNMIQFLEMINVTASDMGEDHKAQILKYMMNPMVSAKVLKNVGDAYLSQSSFSDKTFDEFINGINQNGLIDEDQNAIIIICTYAYIFYDQAPGIINILNKKKYDLEDFISDVYTCMRLSNELIDEKLRSYIRKSMEFSLDNMRYAILSYPVIKDMIEDINQLTPAIILELTLAAQTENHMEQGNELAKQCAQYGRKYNIPVEEQKKLYDMMVELLEKRDGRDTLPNVEFTIPASYVIEGYPSDHFIVCKRVPYDSPRQFFLGYPGEYDNCFRIGGAAEAAIRYSISEPDAGNYECYTIEADGTEIEKVFTCFAWTDRKTGGICLDSLEIADDNWGIIGKTQGAVQILANKLHEEHGVPIVTAGTAYTDIPKDEFPGRPPIIKTIIDPNLINILKKYGVSDQDLLYAQIFEENGVYTTKMINMSTTILEVPDNLKYSDADKYQQILSGDIYDTENFPPYVSYEMFFIILDILKNPDIEDSERKYLHKILSKCAYNMSTNIDTRKILNFTKCEDIFDLFKVAKNNLDLDIDEIVLNKIKSSPPMAIAAIFKEYAHKFLSTQNSKLNVEDISEYANDFVEWISENKVILRDISSRVLRGHFLEFLNINQIISEIMYRHIQNATDNGWYIHGSFRINRILGSYTNDDQDVISLLYVLRDIDVEDIEG